eukprot:468212-Karenia_brevis.AAC.1
MAWMFNVTRHEELMTCTLGHDNVNFVLGGILLMGGSSLDVVIFSAAISACEKGGQCMQNGQEVLQKYSQ